MFWSKLGAARLPSSGNLIDFDLLSFEIRCDSSFGVLRWGRVWRGSRLPNALVGTAYHAHELLYLSGNLDNEMSEREVAKARKFAEAWIRFANGLAPWHVHGERKWMIWGQDSKVELMNEDEDEQVRDYTRMRMMLELEDEGRKIWER